jgi:hypothetical protein
MKPSLMWQLQFECKVFLSKKIQVPWCWNFELRLVKKMNSNTFILTNLKVVFEPCVLNLIWKWFARDTKRKEDHPIFMNFRVKKFYCKKDSKKENFDVWTLLSHGSHGLKGCNFLWIIYKKVVWKFYNYFIKCSYVDFWRK